MNRIGVLCLAAILVIPRLAGSGDANNGACCLGNGHCLELTEEQCALIPNTRFGGHASTCRDLDGLGVAEACHQVRPRLFLRYARSTGLEIATCSPGQEVPEVVFTTDVYPESGFYDALTDRLYFFRYKSIYCSSIDGTTLDEVVVEPQEAGVIDWMMPDPAERRIYWRVGDVIRRCRFDGSDVETVRMTRFPNTDSGASFDRILSLASAHSCGALRLDSDFDQDVDLADFARFQNCFADGAP